MRLVFLHSPFVGPLSWLPTAEQFTATGHAAEVPDLRGGLRRHRCVASFIAAAVAAVDRGPAGRTVLIGHSRSGPLLPAVAGGCQRPVAGLIFTDSALPHPGRSWADQAPPEHAAWRRNKVVAGLLPPWSEWWPPAEVARLLPDPGLRARFVSELPKVPGSYLDERLPDVDWRGKSGYLQLSPGYAAPAAAARSAGWAVTGRDLDHLATLTAPVAVAAAITELLDDLALTGS